jgi:hypothetical protein
MNKKNLSFFFILLLAAFYIRPLLSSAEAEGKAGQNTFDPLNGAENALNRIKNILAEKKSSHLRSLTLCGRRKDSNGVGPLQDLSFNIQGIIVYFGPNNRACNFSEQERSIMGDISFAANRAESFCTGEEFKMVRNEKVSTFDPIGMGDIKALKNGLKSINNGLARIHSSLKKQTKGCLPQSHIASSKEKSIPRSGQKK